MTAFKGLGTTGNGAGVVTPLDHKLAQAALVAKTTTALLVRAGVFFGGNASLVAGTAGMAYSVAAYDICTQRSATAGVVFGGNDGALSVATTAAPGSNSRIDIIFHWHREFSIDGVDSNPVIGVIQGTPAASPAAPSLAAFPGAVELARATVAAGATATNGAGVTITQTAPFTTMDGGMLVERSKAALDAVTNLAGRPSALVLADGIIYKWNGTMWKEWESDWITWSTLPTNIVVGTLGAASSLQRYKWIGGRLYFEYKFVLGSSGASVGTTPLLNLPLSLAMIVPNLPPTVGEGAVYDVSAAAVTYTKVRLASATTARIDSWAAGAYVGVTATAPITFAAGDVIAGSFWGDPA